MQSTVGLPLGYCSEYFLPTPCWVGRAGYMQEILEIKTYLCPLLLHSRHYPTLIMGMTCLLWFSRLFFPLRASADTKTKLKIRCSEILNCIEIPCQRCVFHGSRRLNQIAKSSRTVAYSEAVYGPVAVLLDWEEQGSCVWILHVGLSECCHSSSEHLFGKAVSKWLGEAWDETWRKKLL